MICTRLYFIPVIQLVPCVVFRFVVTIRGLLSTYVLPISIPIDGRVLLKTLRVNWEKKEGIEKRDCRDVVREWKGGNGIHDSSIRHLTGSVSVFDLRISCLLSVGTVDLQIRGLRLRVSKIYLCRQIKYWRSFQLLYKLLHCVTKG